MIEIVCPSCGARYQVPAEALGAHGRDVTCSSCGHVWHARPPQAEAAPPPPPYEPAPAEPPQPQAPAAAPDNRDRRRQMADIRQMLDEVQTAERRRGETAQPPAEGTQRWSGRDAPQTRDRRRPPADAGAEDEDDFFLRDRVGVAGQSGRLRSVRERAREGEGDRRKLMERHVKRDRRQEASRRRGSGWGYTGFTLMILMFALFVGLYAFHPAIAERYPQWGQAMADYATAVETLRTEADALFGTVTDFVGEKIAEFRGEG